MRRCTSRPGLEAVAIRSGESLYANELKSGAVERKFGSNTAEPSASTTKQGGSAQSNIRRSGPASIRHVPAPVIDSILPAVRAGFAKGARPRMAMFIDKLHAGRVGDQIRFARQTANSTRCRVGHAMYVPEIRYQQRGNRITVTGCEANRLRLTRHLGRLCSAPPGRTDALDKNRLI